MDTRKKNLFTAIKKLIDNLYTGDAAGFIETLAEVQQYRFSDGFRFLFDYILLIFHMQIILAGIKQNSTDKTISIIELLSMVEDKIIRENINRKVFLFYKKMFITLFINHETYVIYDDLKEDIDLMPNKINNFILNTKKDINFYFTNYLWPARLTIYDYVIVFIGEPDKNCEQNYRKIVNSLHYKSFDAEIKQLIHYYYKQYLQSNTEKRTVRFSFPLDYRLYKKIAGYARKRKLSKRKAMHIIIKAFLKKNNGK